MAEADVVLLVQDATTQSHEEDERTIATLTDRPYLLVINKIDLTQPARSTSVQTLQTSAKTGHGIPELRQAILTLITQKAPAAETAILTNLRQQQAVTATLAALSRAGKAATSSIPHEMILLDLYEALGFLDTLTGTTTTDDILNLIFSKFCIGK